ncbi:hypothetical protein L1987_34444 [Smallanthus sonchifolius]|uniref:Uncharacterized protein n=1 Tax=Smallanthus sonchifolius TaxID=185202 RepID=A0ACB9HTP7_9ASTR|nr:hypothetical protein L1987_34444 [Smallanthus sonchifolius]
MNCSMQDGRQEEVNQVFGDRKPYDTNSNSYHPSSRNHPNFKYGDASNQLNPNFQGSNQDDEESKRENEVRDKSHAALERQVGQLAQEIAQFKQNEGKLPSDTTLNPKHHVSAIDVAHGNEEGEEREEEEIEFGEPLVLIQIGEFKTNLTLLDYGAGVSILPGSVYDQYNFDPLKEYNTTLVLANATCTRPRGKLVGVAVKIGEFYYPRDFLVIDYAPLAKEEEPRVILGRPFLATANAQINCRNGTVDMTFGIANEGDTKKKGIMFDKFNVKDEPKEIEKETERLKDAKKPPDHVQHPNEKGDLFDVEFTREETWSWSDNNQGGGGASRSKFVFQPP